MGYMQSVRAFGGDNWELRVLHGLLTPLKAREEKNYA